MIFFIIYLLALCTGLINWFLKRKQGISLVETLLLHQLFFLGVSMFFAFYGHIFMSETIAKEIGWVSNGFQKELGMVSLGIGICGFLSVKYRGLFWIPIIIIYATFNFGAAFFHIQQMMTVNNFNVLNTVIVIPDIIIPGTMIVLALIMHHNKKNKNFMDNKQE